MSEPTMSEETKRSLEAAAALLGTKNALKVVKFIYQLGVMDGSLRMARSQAVRVDQAMRSML